jgi:hypothetical protein
MQTYHEAAVADLAVRVSDVEKALVTSMGVQERKRIGILALVQSRRAERMGEPELATRALNVAASCLAV